LNLTEADQYVSFNARNTVAHIDNLSISAVPEPGSLAIGIGGLLAAVALRRRVASGSPIA
jgi:MYXO-CTERM domain-containing protein